MTEMLTALQGQINETPEHGDEQTQWGNQKHTYNGMDIYQAAQAGEVGVVMLLWYNGVSVNLKQSEPPYATALHHAAFNGNTKICEFLLDHAAEIDIRIPDTDVTPLMWACTAGHFSVVKLLIERGADPCQVEAQDYNSAFHAVHTGNTPLVHYLLSGNYGIDPHAVDKAGHNMAQWAAFKGALGCLRYLHETVGVSVEGLDKERRTALHWAAHAGQYVTAEYLLSLKLNKLDIRDSDGQTAAELAAASNHKAVENLINDYVKSGPLNYAAPRSESTLKFLFSSFRNIRFALYGLICMPLAYYVIVKFVPLIVSVLLVPCVFIVPGTLDYLVFRNGRPPVRTIAPRSNSPLATRIQMLSGSGERDMSVLFASMLLQGFLLHSFFGSSVGDTTKNWSPMLYSSMQFLTAVGLFSYVICLIKRPASPDISELSPAKQEEIKRTPGTYSYEAMEMKSLRSSHCPLIGRVVSGYDQFNTMTDTAIGKGNRLWYIMWIGCIGIVLTLITISTVRWSIYVVAPSNANYSICRTIGRFLRTSLPGSSKNPGTFLVPSHEEILGMQLIVVSAVFALFCLARFAAQVYLVGLNFTKAEVDNPICLPIVDKGPSMMVLQNGNSCYTAGSFFSNWKNFVIGSESYNSHFVHDPVKGYGVFGEMIPIECLCRLINHNSHLGLFTLLLNFTMLTKLSTVEVMRSVCLMDSYDPIVSVIAEIMKMLSEGEVENALEPKIYCGDTKMDITNLLRRFVRYAKCSHKCFVYASALVDRVSTRGNIDVTGKTVHRLLHGCIVLAIKWIEDEVFPNSHYAEIGGLTLQEFNVVERQVLHDLDWDISIDGRTIRKYEDQLQQHWIWNASRQDIKKEKFRSSRIHTLKASFRALPLFGGKKSKKSQ